MTAAAADRARASHTVLVVDDHPVVRQGLAALLESADWVATIHEAATLAAAREQCLIVVPDLAIVDIHLPDGDGLSFVEELAGIAPGCRSLVLTMDQDEPTIRAAVKAGAHGYLVKDEDPEVILQGLRTIALGGAVYGDGVVGRGMRRPAHATPHHGPFESLTERERTIARLACEGLTNRQIVSRIDVADKTVRNHLSNILHKVGARDRVHLVLLAQQHSFIPSPDSAPHTTGENHGTNR